MKYKIMHFFNLMYLAILIALCKIILPKERVTEEMLKTFKRECKRF
jgi:hypothetical protein